MPAPRAHAGVEYRVDQVRETVLGDKIKPEALEALLNERASEGWILNRVVAASVKGRVGPGGTEGLLVIFERPASP
jgi:hypothetical protein